MDSKLQVTSSCFFCWEGFRAPRSYLCIYQRSTNNAHFTMWVNGTIRFSRDPDYAPYLYSFTDSSDGRGSEIY